MQFSMEYDSVFHSKMIFPTILIFSVFSCIWGSPVQFASSSGHEGESTKPHDSRLPLKALDCNPVEYSLKDVIFLKNNDIFLKSENLTVHSTEYRQEKEKILVCPPYEHISSKTVWLNCTRRFLYYSYEFEILPNGSVLAFGEMIPPSDYIQKGKDIQICAPDDEDYSEFGIPVQLTLSQVSIYVGQAGSLISIIALLVHLIIFCIVPTLRNLPGYNITSLCVAFLLGYSSLLVGQIPQVLGIYCILSAVLQQNFFLSAFFCMNVLAFDVFKTLKNATKLFMRPQSSWKKQFIWYSIYAWGCPLVITTLSVIVDNSDSFPDIIKPFYGRKNTCWLTNSIARTIFFSAPAFTLFMINAVFFFRSSWIISSNRMSLMNVQNQQSVKLNYVLYIRLALMMGLSWLTGVIAILSENDIVWLIFDILNSLQGLFLFILFSCNRKVLKHLREKTNSKKQTVVSSSSNNFTSKTDINLKLEDTPIQK